MIKDILLLFLQIWFIMGFVSVIWVYIAMKLGSNKDFMENFKELSEESELSEDYLKGIVFLVVFVFGILALPYAIIQKLLKILKKDSKNG